MSRGPGRVERAIAAAFAEADPDVAFTTDDFCAVAFPEDGGIEKKHRVSVLRAARRLPGAWGVYREHHCPRERSSPGWVHPHVAAIGLWCFGYAGPVVFAHSPEAAWRRLCVFQSGSGTGKHIAPPRGAWEARTGALINVCDDPAEQRAREFLSERLHPLLRAFGGQP